jgi:Sulfotransferase family
MARDGTSTPRPLFLFSLPRSGSTLVQRVLAAHDAISTTPEPWLLLPLVYATREGGTYAEYGEVPAVRAIREFAERLPNGRDDWDEEIRTLAVRLYGRASGGGTTYFLDKTPRYHFVVDDVLRIFPDARSVFLWRNPLAVVASIVETWAGGAWSIGRWRADLFDGLARLVAAYEANAHRAHAIRYEALVCEPELAWPSVFAYLDLSFDPSFTSALRTADGEARMGDRTGASAYDHVSAEPLEKWKRVLTSGLRVDWCRRYLRWIGEHRLAVMGYDLGELLASLDAVPAGRRSTASDAVRMTYGRVAGERRAAAFRRLTERGKW